VIAARETEERNAEQQPAWARTRSPRAPATLAWHRRLADDRRLKKQWSPALWHLDRLVEADPTAWRYRVDRGRVLFRLDQRSEAEQEFARAASGHPDDSELWIERGTAYAEIGRWDQTAADFIHAIDRGAGDPRVWYWRALAGLGGDLTDTYGRLKRRLLDRALIRKPNDPELWLDRGRTLAGQRQWPGVVATTTKAIALDPGASGPWIERGRAHAEQGQWRQAASDLAQALAIGVGSEDWLVVHEAAIAQLGSGDAHDYHRLCTRILAHFAQTEDPETARGVAYTCALAEGAVTDLSRPVRLAEKAIAGEWPEGGPNWRFRATLALALYRAGRYDAALQRAREAIAASPEGDNGANRLLLAMAHHRLGNAGDARRWLQKGLAWQAGKEADWHDRLVYQILRREAHAMLAE
jgi:Flp pilus assembly protein TadD